MSKQKPTKKPVPPARVARAAKAVNEAISTLTMPMPVYQMGVAGGGLSGEDHEYRPMLDLKAWTGRRDLVKEELQEALALLQR